ncbi:uncharacterized protein MKZ38_001881 [Zalerion maritima]|uniref:Ribosome assembly protein 3 n=1 Tax=Zalerion maritima TaxID=339359 RepID=A0AAD5WSU1_9PEZI|nr:uncharacterized protein MKZ38_001881 [Zalerion maritima]
MAKTTNHADSNGGPPAEQENKEVKQQFTAFCLQKATTEFADDLAKIREAHDFANDSLPILIGALQQTACLYTEGQMASLVDKGSDKQS